MQRVIEAMDGALCHMPAERWALPRGDGYLYECPACGGRYSIAPSAISHAESDGGHPDLLAAVRACIARGDLPRVAIVGDQWQPLEVIGRQGAESDPA
ncbi:hypothetical protein [Cupriavidus taiwanensis]|uniref:hypothetical protein n=1 Tax=Cupriavidus taiwanensis TaxID=164546 RepID=UPI0039C42E86